MMILNNTFFAPQEFLFLPFLLFIVGFIGSAYGRKNLILFLVGIEIMLLGSTLNFVLMSIIFNNTLGQLYALTVLAIAAAESAIGLGILVVIFRIQATIDFHKLNLMRG